MWGEETNKTDKIKIYATADLHLPIGPYKDFLRTLDGTPDLFLIAGDVVDRGRYVFLKRFEEDIKKFSCPKLMVRGNNEYTYEETKKYLKDIKLLEDERVDIEIKGRRIALIGTPGILDRPTRWQKKNIPGIEEIYKKRFEKIKEISKRPADFKILISHYSVTFLNTPKDPKPVWPELGSEKWLEILGEFDVVIHGHVHYGKTFSLFGKTRIYNVSLFQNKGIVKIDL